MPGLDRLAAAHEPDAARARPPQGPHAAAGAPRVGAAKGLERHPQERHARAHRGQLCPGRVVPDRRRGREPGRRRGALQGLQGRLAARQGVFRRRRVTVGP